MEFEKQPGPVRPEQSGQVQRGVLSLRRDAALKSMSEKPVSLPEDAPSPEDLIREDRDLKRSFVQGSHMLTEDFLVNGRPEELPNAEEDF